MSRGSAPLGVELARVDAIDSSGRGGSALGRLSRVDWRCAIGLHWIIGSPADGLVALWGVLCGATIPTRGHCFVAGSEPARSAELRSRIAELGPAPRLLGRRVVDTADVARDPRARLDGLERLGGRALLQRPVAGLSTSEARSVELAFALSVPDPALVVLYEPWSLTSALEPYAVRREISRLAERAPVIVLSSSAAGAPGATEHTWALDSGRLGAHGIEGRRDRGTAFGLDVVVRDADGRGVTKILDGLAARRVPHVGASWDGSPGDTSLRLLRVRTDAVDEVAREVTLLAAELDLDVRSIETARLESAAFSRAPRRDGTGGAA